MEASRIDIRRLTQTELIDSLVAMGEKKFRASQVYHWLWKQFATDFDSMTTLSKELRDTLKANFVINGLTEDMVQISDDGTIKSRFELFDGNKSESVLIPVEKDNRYTVCVSTQVGCSLSCSFCATGKMKRSRNLSAAEIVDQVILVNKQCIERYGRGLTNVVYMGMGEPLLNYKETLRSIDIISSEDGLHMSPRRITVSTAGIAKMIDKLTEDEVRFNLALSLHAADDTKRDEIMPINESNDLDTLMDSLKNYYYKTRNRISFEYIAFAGFNDTMEDAKNLANLCRAFPVRVNIIEYNQVDGVALQKSSENRLDKFAAALAASGVTTTVRRSRGKDIDAACGQLANKED